VGNDQSGFTDFVVFLPGIMGSTLSRHGRPVWAPSGGAVLNAVRTFGRSLTELELPAGVGDEHPDDGVLPVMVMPDIHVLPGIWTAHVGYGVILDWLRTTFGVVPVTADGPPGNLLAVPYDWRLSNRYNGRRLGELVEPALERWRGKGGPYADARVVVIAHSMGGLVARWWIQREGGSEVVRKLVTLGTPHRGALNALEQLVNGVRKGPWPFRLDLTKFARSLPALHELLPAYACLQSADQLATTTEVSLPEVSTAMVADAMAFHTELDDAANPAWPAAFDLHPVLGQKQRTATTARLAGDEVVPIPTIEGVTEGGDATVPALSATPRALRPSDPSVVYITERHGSLQSNRSVLDQVEGILTAREIIHRAPTEIDVDLRVDDVIEAAEPLVVEAVLPGGEAVPLEAQLVDEHGVVADRQRLARAGDGFRAVFDPPSAGAFEIQLRGYGSARASVTPVTAPVVVWGEEE
jgi:pimeloyl-ACP methyl ester carboxylesterase